VDLGADPLTASLAGRPAPSIDDIVTVVGKARDYDGGVRAITVDGPTFHGLGASASWELAGAVAAGVSYLRLLGERGISASNALAQIVSRFAADDDQFMTIASSARPAVEPGRRVVGRPDAAPPPSTP
jgi:methylmalonyl-CoA mutase